jgi:preprotein translocase subunit SecD
MEIKTTRVYDFMSIRRYWIAFSLIMSILSAVLIWKPGPRYGIDFLGGTELTVQFNGPVSTDDIRTALERMGNERPEVRGRRHLELHHPCPTSHRCIHHRHQLVAVGGAICGTQGRQHDGPRQCRRVSTERTGQ